MTQPSYYPHAKPGLLRITGADRVGFLQRQSTNDLQRLSPGSHLSTVLTNPAARIIDVLQIFHAEPDTLQVITLPGRAEATAIFLKRRVFFMDKVAIENASAGHCLLDVEGPGAEDVLSALGLQAPGEGSVESGSYAGFPVWLLGQRGPGGQSIRLAAARAAQAALATALENAGAALLSPADYETRRVEAGIPGPAGELVEEYTPLEAGLQALISASKGCYTGQEVIARQITYDKITRSLIGLRLDGPVSAGSRVQAAGATAGTVTSYTHSDRLGHLALAMLKRPHFEPGTDITVPTDDGVVLGVTAALPFDHNIPAA